MPPTQLLLDQRRPLKPEIDERGRDGAEEHVEVGSDGGEEAVAVVVRPGRDERALLESQLEAQHDDKVHAQHHKDAPSVRQSENGASDGAGHHLRGGGYNYYGEEGRRGSSWLGSPLIQRERHSCLGAILS